MTHTHTPPLGPHLRHLPVVRGQVEVVGIVADGRCGSVSSLLLLRHRHHPMTLPRHHHRRLSSASRTNVPKFSIILAHTQYPGGLCVCVNVYVCVHEETTAT